MVRSNPQQLVFRSLEYREKAVVTISTLYILCRVYLTPYHQENAGESVVLGILTITIALLGEPDIPASLCRNGSSGLYYGLVLVAAVCVGISEHVDKNSAYSAITLSLAKEQVKASVWMTIFFYFPRFKLKSFSGYSVQSLAVFFVSGVIMQYLLQSNTSPTLFMHVASSLSLAKICSTRFPACFTCGELLLLTNMVVPLLLNYHNLSSNVGVSLIANYVLLFVTFFILTLVPFAVFGMLTTKLFYSSGIMIFSCLLYKLSELLYEGVAMWIINFVSSNLPHRVGLLILWVTEILACILYVLTCRPLTKKSNTTERKIFHVVILVTFIPAFYLDIPLVFICSVGATCLLVLLEAMRALHIPPLAKILDERFSVFVDAQDQGHLILTPIYLLLGQSLPIWGACLQQPQLLTSSVPALHLAVFSGILSVAIGDTAASVVGSKFGKLRWAGSKKTVEGTVAAIISQTAFTILIRRSSLSLFEFAAITSVSLIEAYTSQIDNLILPIYMYFLLNTVH